MPMQLTTRIHSVPLLRPFVTAARRTDTVQFVVADVLLETGCGTTVRGQGTAAETVRVTGEDAASITAALEGPIRTSLATAPVLPEDPDVSSALLVECSRRICDSLPDATSAKAAAEVAVHDALGRALGRSVIDLLGGDSEKARQRPLAMDMTISLEDPPTMALRAAEAVERGYRILKIKLGGDEDEDRRRLGAVVDAAPQVRLRLDANQGWDVDEAIRVMGWFEADGLPIDLIEQPVERRDLPGMARVRRETAVPVMADESLWSVEDAERILEADAADMFNIKLAKTGGLQPARAIADIAQSAGIPCMVGAMMEPRISIAAAAQLAAAHPAITMIDLDSPEWFAINEPAGGYEVRAGDLHLLGGPGLGLAALGGDPHRLSIPSGGIA